MSEGKWFIMLGGTLFWLGGGGWSIILGGWGWVGMSGGGCTV